jgi:hypothetical protein
MGGSIVFSIVNHLCMEYKTQKRLTRFARSQAVCDSIAKRAFLTQGRKAAKIF